MVALKLPVALQMPAPNKAHDARTPARLAVAHLGSDGLTHARHARHLQYLHDGSILEALRVHQPSHSATLRSPLKPLVHASPSLFTTRRLEARRRCFRALITSCGGS